MDAVARRGQAAKGIPEVLEQLVELLRDWPEDVLENPKR
jgi:hypothetical protein